MCINIEGVRQTSGAAEGKWEGTEMKLIKHLADVIIDMLFRGAIGLVFVYLIGMLCRFCELPVIAGVNLATFLMMAILGIPGFFLAFAIGLLGYF